MRITIRLFAAAREAVGAPETTRELAGPVTTAEVLGALTAGLAPAAAGVVDRCSVLVDGVADPGRSSVLADGAVVDVLPPFAGG